MIPISPGSTFASQHPTMINYFSIGLITLLHTFLQPAINY